MSRKCNLTFRNVFMSFTLVTIIKKDKNMVVSIYFKLKNKIQQLFLFKTLSKLGKRDKPPYFNKKYYGSASHILPKSIMKHYKDLKWSQE